MTFRYSMNRWRNLFSAFLLAILFSLPILHGLHAPGIAHAFMVTDVHAVAQASAHASNHTTAHSQTSTEPTESTDASAPNCLDECLQKSNTRTSVTTLYAKTLSVFAPPTFESFRFSNTDQSLFFYNIGPPQDTALHLITQTRE